MTAHDPAAGNAGPHRRRVVVCDADGNPMRSADVLEVHQGAGVLHRAFSVFVFRSGGTELLLQQRSRQKPLFSLRWANTCCSHPSPAEESLVAAAQRRLQEELGFSVALREAGAFVYRAADAATGLTEYEHDTVLVGETRRAIAVIGDPAEIADWRWVSVAELQQELRDESEKYAPWLPQALRIALTACQRGSAA